MRDDIALVIAILREIEQAVVEDTPLNAPDTKYRRIDNAVRIYCAKILEPLK